jgi:hypothetical protein
LITKSDLLKTFRDLDLRVKKSLAEEPSPQNVGLAALKVAHDAGADRVSLADLHEALEEADVSIKLVSLTKGLASAGKRVTRKKADGLVLYRLAIPGHQVAAEILGGGEIELMFVDGNKPRTDRRRLGEILGGLKGTIRICDPYYGVRSLETLELLPSTADVRFLTAKTNEGTAKLAGPLKDFKKERSHIALRQVQNANDLHDRYVLTKDNLLIVGHGLKDIGTKESFVVQIPASLAPDLLTQVERAFDTKWAAATAL